MSLKHKVKRASQILEKDGLSGLVRGLSRALARSIQPKQPNESKIAFDVLLEHYKYGVMLDVGAHYGGSLSPFLDKGWDVYAFEPDSQNRKLLVDSYGSYENIHIDKRAVSDRPQERVTLYRSNQSTGISGLSSFHDSHFEGEEVAVTTLEAFILEMGLGEKEISFLKIDTEGFDFPVLKGVPWETHAPKLILCEFEDSKTIPLGYSFHDLAQFLQSKGYKLIVSEWHPVKEYGGHHEWNRFVDYPCKLMNQKAWGNILATNDEEIHASLLQRCKMK